LSVTNAVGAALVVSMVAENRRLAAPASLDGGIPVGLQEDMVFGA